MRVESTAGPELTVLDGSGRTAVSMGPGGGLVGFSIENTNGLAVSLAGGGSLLEGNVFDGSARTARMWVVVDGVDAAPLIRRNRFRDHVCSGVTRSGVLSFTGTSSPIVENNVFEHNSCIALRVELSDASDPLVVNNTFVANSTAIQVVRTQSVSSQIYRNNILFGNSMGLELRFGVAGDTPGWDHNLMFDNLVEYNEDPDPSGTGSNLAMDPMLMDPGAGRDYRLGVGSPAIDSGESLGAPTDDLERTLRPLDGDGDGLAMVDLGAFEMLPPPEPEPELEITIDVKPGSDLNPVLLGRGRGVIPVALMGADDVDVRSVVPASLAFGPGGAPLAHRHGPHYADIDGDGRLDLLAHFRVMHSGITPGEEEVCVTGELDGVFFSACDAIWVVRPRWGGRR